MNTNSALAHGIINFSAAMHTVAQMLNDLNHLSLSCVNDIQCRRGTHSELHYDLVAKLTLKYKWKCETKNTFWSTDQNHHKKIKDIHKFHQNQSLTTAIIFLLQLHHE